MSADLCYRALVLDHDDTVVASSKTIQTADTLLDTVMNLKR